MKNNENKEELTELEQQREILKEKKEFDEEMNERRKKRNVGRIITNLIIVIIFVIIIFEAAIGILNMQRISDDKEPVWYLSTKTIETDLKTETIYNLGLYKIVKTDTSKQTKVTLKPFFIGD